MKTLPPTTTTTTTTLPFSIHYSQKGLYNIYGILHRLTFQWQLFSDVLIHILDYSSKFSKFHLMRMSHPVLNGNRILDGQPFHLFPQNQCFSNVFILCV